jgi:hypothetical protein
MTSLPPNRPDAGASARYAWYEACRPSARDTHNGAVSVIDEQRETHVSRGVAPGVPGERNQHDVLR